MPAIGTAEQFAACDEMLTRGAAFNKRTGKRCDAELAPALRGLEGKRVECEYYGERVRFYVGKSSGWMPVHLMLKTSRSNCGDPLSPDRLRFIR